MSFDDYVHHMKQKYSLAVALAVIKNKPTDQTTVEYIAALREKLKVQDEMEIDDLNISVCSKDFDSAEDTSTDLTQNNASFLPTQCSNRKTNESPTILADFAFDDLMQGNQIEKSNSLGDTLELLKEMDTVMPMTSKEMGLLNHPDLEQIQTTYSTENVINETQISYLQNDSQIPLHSNQEDNIFSNNMATDMQNTLTAYSEAQKKFSEPNRKVMFEKNNQNIENLIDTQETQLLGFTQENTHVSQSQNIDTRFALLDKYVFGVKKPKILTENNIKLRNDDITKENRIIDDAESSINDLNECGQHFETNYAIHSSVDLNINVIHENNKSCLVLDAQNIYKQITESDNIIQHSNTDNTKSINKQITESENIIQYSNTDNTKNINKQITESESIIQQSNTDNTEKDDRPKQTTIPYSQDTVDLEEEEMFDSQAEPVIPFKIIEELTRIKSTLSREGKRRISSDGSSGYKSDSQSKFSYRSGLQSQSQSTCLNQSGHCLLIYLLNCPLVPNAVEITHEISEVLGDLVDQLHNSEEYPQFIDDILENIKTLLDDIYNSDRNGDTEAMKKDEIVHRLLLLNRSFHIITYTIEKITTNLEKFHSNLTTATDLYEITNIIQMENICHIIHALEILLQRYAKKKQILSSQPTPQMLEGEKTPIRSSIADIWKRKWDPEYKKKEIIANTLEDKCTNLKIGEILNRIVVDCMDGYSLVSFAALQCFNIMQS